MSLIWIQGLAHSAPAGKFKQPFIMGISDNDHDTYGGILVRKVYTETFRRLEIPIQFERVPLKRLTLLNQRGVLDGEVSRVLEYGDKYPDLIRVDESIIDLTFSIYGRDVIPTAKDFKALSDKNYRVSYRRGVGVCEKIMKEHFPKNIVDDSNTTVQTLLQMQKNRIDLFCDVDTSVYLALENPGVNKESIRKVITLKSHVPTYPYLSSKHKNLAPKLAVTIRAIKKEGLYNQFAKEAQQERGIRVTKVKF